MSGYESNIARKEVTSPKVLLAKGAPYSIRVEKDTNALYKVTAHALSVGAFRHIDFKRKDPNEREKLSLAPGQTQVFHLGTSNVRATRLLKNLATIQYGPTEPGNPGKLDSNGRDTHALIYNPTFQAAGYADDITSYLGSHFKGLTALENDAVYILIRHILTQSFTVGDVMVDKDGKEDLTAQAAQQVVYLFLDQNGNSVSGDSELGRDAIYAFFTAPYNGQPGAPSIIALLKERIFAAFRRDTGFSLTNNVTEDQLYESYVERASWFVGTLYPNFTAGSAAGELNRIIIGALDMYTFKSTKIDYFDFIRQKKHVAKEKLITLANIYQIADSLKILKFKQNVREARFNFPVDLSSLSSLSFSREKNLGDEANTYEGEENKGVRGPRRVSNISVVEKISRAIKSYVDDKEKLAGLLNRSKYIDFSDFPGTGASKIAGLHITKTTSNVLGVASGSPSPSNFVNVNGAIINPGNFLFSVLGFKPNSKTPFNRAALEQLYTILRESFGLVDLGISTTHLLAPTTQSVANGISGISGIVPSMMSGSKHAGHSALSPGMGLHQAHHHTNPITQNSHFQIPRLGHLGSSSNQHAQHEPTSASHTAGYYPSSSAVENFDV